MKNILLIILSFTCLNCQNENKKPELRNYQNSKETFSSKSIESVDSTANAHNIIEPVKWSTEINKISEIEYELIIIANIEENYHLYSQKLPEGGPLPTVFIFEESDDYELLGTISEEKGSTEFDSIFKINVKSFKSKATFKQRIKINQNKKFRILAEIEFMSCNNEKCLTGFSDIDFQI